ncbi:MAG: M1 family metallopeptidase, partial [Longimicrobiales bacterium]
MTIRSFIVLSLLAGMAGLPAEASSQERAIRRDVPLTNSIRRAFAAGTRDSTGRPGRRYWQLRTDYTISARLDPSTSILSGSETVVVHNTSDSAMTSIVLRLDQNIFRPSVPRASPSVPSEITDGLTLTKLTVNGEAVNMNPPSGRGAGGAPGSHTASGLTQTVARIALSAPIPAKSTATIEVDWNFKLAGGAGGSGHRMTARWADSLYQVTQWYPRIAVFDDLRDGGWDTDLYLGPSEFYNNFGRFDVRIDVPAGWIVGATGVLQNPERVLTPTMRERLSRVLASDSTITIVGETETGPDPSTAAGDRLVWHFLADTVNDFAWGTARQFVWKATRATIPGAGRVPIHMMYLPGRAQLYANAASLTRYALEFYSKLWMPYGFAQLTLLDGPDTGMEYPMVIMSNQGAADHEAAHSWWPMMVSGNETWYGWMDEGF